MKTRAQGSRSRSQSVREGPFTKFSTIFGGIQVMIGLAGLAITVLTLGYCAGPRAPIPAPSPSVSSLPVIPPTRISPMPTSACLRTDGSPVACSADDAYLPVAASECTPSAASSALGTDQDLELLIETASIGERCAVRPSPPARDAGARASDLLDASPSPRNPAVLACWIDLNPQNVVPCSALHRFEPVGPWRPLDDPHMVQPVCSSAVAKFTATPVDTLGSRVTSDSLISSDSQYRCFAKVQDSVKGTVYLINGRSEPSTGRPR